MCKMTKYELSKIHNGVKVILETHFKNFYLNKICLLILTRLTEMKNLENT